MNKMTALYIGYVEEIIYKEGTPTMELRVRVPTIHGLGYKTGISRENLPIAKPLFFPGIIYNKEKFEEAFQSLNKVYIVFEAGDENRPVYLGLVGNSNLYDIPFESGE